MIEASIVVAEAETTTEIAAATKLPIFSYYMILCRACLWRMSLRTLSAYLNGSESPRSIARD